MMTGKKYIFNIPRKQESDLYIFSKTMQAIKCKIFCTVTGEQNKSKLSTSNSGPQKVILQK